MNPIMWMHQICNNYFIGKATAVGRLSKSRPEEVRHAYLTKYSMWCVGGRSHGCCVIAVFLQSLNEALLNLSCTIWNKNVIITIHFSIMAECLWRRGIIVCIAPRVRCEIKLNFYDLICLQVLSHLEGTSAQAVWRQLLCSSQWSATDTLCQLWSPTFFQALGV